MLMVWLVVGLDEVLNARLSDSNDCLDVGADGVFGNDNHLKANR